MSEVVTAANLDELLHHQRWLQERLAEYARNYLRLHEELQGLDPESDEHATVKGDLYACAAQLEMTSGDVVQVMDEVIDALPDDDA
jgi:hypothetical protein